MKVRAKDADEGENGRITYHFKVNDTDVQETDEFFIHPDTGDLRTKIILDREVKSKYEVSSKVSAWELVTPLTLTPHLYPST